MFGNHAFQTWTVIVAGATVFAMLFMVVGMMTELVFEGVFQMTPGVASFGLAAFVGYMGTAVAVRRQPRDP